MGSKNKQKDDGVLMRRIAVYLAGFLGGLLIYSVLKVGTRYSIIAILNVHTHTDDDPTGNAAR